MARRLPVFFILLVALPLAVLPWLAVRLARAEEVRAGQAVRAAAERQLALVMSAAENGADATGRDLEALLTIPQDAPAAQLRERALNHPMAQQAFLIDASGGFVYPNPKRLETTSERRFFEVTENVWASRDRFFTGAQPGREETLSAGWHSWFHGGDVEFLYWKRIAPNRVAGVLVNRAAFLSRIIGALPHTDNEVENRANSERITLRDTAQRALYQWGGYEPPVNAEPTARLSLRPPLGMWTLGHYRPGGPAIRFSRAPLMLGAVAIAVALVTLGALAWRESTRAVREAEMRVGFVNQVSHELKSPLTNVRLYSELAVANLGTEDSRARSHLEVAQAELDRLGRMINNVLAFAKHERGRMKLHLVSHVPDAVVESTLQHFRIALETRDINVEHRLAAPDAVLLDPNVLEQILGNLLSNVEKYAADGKHLSVGTFQTPVEVRVSVTDRGPGIPSGAETRIFAPFQRLDDRVTEGVSGAGIGLTIARELARLHGGDLWLERNDQPGATFVFTLHPGKT